jgi:hypothetical protein
MSKRVLVEEAGRNFVRETEVSNFFMVNYLLLINPLRKGQPFY